MKPLLVIALVALSACEDSTVTPVSGAECQAADLQELVGQDKSVLETMKFAGPTRFINPGDAVTMDFRLDRLNFDFDETGKITRIWCG
ncbi:MAG: I78 family peptidase inhibitor [Pseudomonadota bacterium]